MGEQAMGGPWPPQWPDISDPVVLRAIAEAPRHLFVPPEYRADAYMDAPQPIGQGQTISQPYIVALMTQALALGPASRVLEIGTGSGYQAAVLASITPHVWSVERLPELAAQAEALLHQLNYPVEVKVGDGCLGWPEHAPYDAIIVTAAGTGVPPPLPAQLADGGRLVIPVGSHEWDQTLWLIERRGDRLRSRALAGVRFVPLVTECDEMDERETGILADMRRQINELFNSWKDR